MPRTAPEAALPQRMPQLDSLRALAFLTVALSHWLPHKYQFGLPWGMGVQLFFVLSGFLITGILLEYRHFCETCEGLSFAQGLRTFYIRRGLRILPLFYLVIGLTVLLGIEPIRHTWKWHVCYASNFYYYNSGVPDSFRHFWSLAVEEQFYLLWPILIFFLPRPAIAWATLLLVLSAPVVRIFAASAHHRINYVPLACFDALGTGAILAYCLRFRAETQWLSAKISSRFSLILLSGAIGVFVLLWGYNPEGPWLMSIGHTLIVFLFGWMVYLCATGLQGGFGRMLESRSLVFLRQISYSLYIFHNFLTGIQLRPVFEFLTIPAEHADSILFRLPFQICLTVILAVISWYCFEAPINRLKRHFRIQDQRGEQPKPEQGSLSFSSP